MKQSGSQSYLPTYYHQANIQNFGLVAYDNGWLYYSNSSDDWKLYKIDIYGKNKQKLFDYPVRDINVSNEWIYFHDETFDDLNITLRIKKDGSSQQVLSKDTSSGIYVTEQFVYYVNADDGKLYKMKKDGSNKSTVMNEEVNGYWINNNDIYYRKQDIDSLIVKNSNNNSIKLLNSNIGHVLVIEDYIYYIDISDNDTIYKMRTNGSEKTKVCKDKIGDINYIDGFIVFANYSDEGKLYKMKLDGSNKVKICDDIVFEINVAYKWIFYRNTKNGNMYRISLNGTDKQVF